MKKITIYYTPEFRRLWRKVPENIKKKAATKEKIFRKNPFSPPLRTHKLKGILEGFYSFSIDCHFRIVFHFQDKDIYFDSVGTHSIYK